MAWTLIKPECFSQIKFYEINKELPRNRSHVANRYLPILISSSFFHCYVAQKRIKNKTPKYVQSFLQISKINK